MEKNGLSKIVKFTLKPLLNPILSLIDEFVLPKPHMVHLPQHILRQHTTITLLGHIGKQCNIECVVLFIGIEGRN